ncbi:hypothetical protein [Desulfobacter postgatei]|uniref:hypothetical protein n=1 Tax=Desulfobacter postgatei TaxID=2293 RepID=UPI002478C390|nr:hypothetical protein [Desulfobacter postgatei]
MKEKNMKVLKHTETNEFKPGAMKRFFLVQTSEFFKMAEFERELIREPTNAGLVAGRARGRKGGRKFSMSRAQVRLAQAAMKERDTSVADLCNELATTRATLYRYVGPNGELREHGRQVLGVNP